MTTCARCHRPLTDPDSIAAGMGPICSSREKNLGETQGENIYLVPDDPKAPGDVFFRRLPDGKIETNVRHAWVNHSPDGYEWGYGGSGPAELALNILLRFMDRGRAWVLHQEFKWVFISGAPHQGARIPKAEIENWIKSKQQLLQLAGLPPLL